MDQSSSVNLITSLLFEPKFELCILGLESVLVCSSTYQKRMYVFYMFSLGFIIYNLGTIELNA